MQNQSQTSWCTGWCLAFFFFVLCNVQFAFPWKPIVSSGSPISSYSLKQSHPGEASSSSDLATSFTHFSEDKDNDDDIVLPHTTLLNGIQTVVAVHPATLSEDDENHYESYISKDDVFNKASSLSISGSSLYSSDHCSVKKFAFNQDGVVTYANELPELDQFTLCFWMRFTNHSGDHVMLTYQTEKESREIQIWVANAQNSSFLSMAIKGQQMYRLNYPLRMRQWHHMCSSWNGKTGEWQVWLKAERIGRGFHNSLVGHKIPSKGKLHSGGKSVTGEVSHGLHFEVTIIQIYRVALSAGKAHRDHKHHHVHHFDHEGQEVSSTARVPPMINRPQPMHSLLASGQIPTSVRINLANSVPSPMPPAGNSDSSQFQPQQSAITVNTNFVNGQINSGSRLVAQQLLNMSPFHQSRQTTIPASTNNPGRFHMLSNSANVQFIDETESHIQFKRNTVTMKDKKKLEKRNIVLLDDGSLVDDGLDNTEGTQESDLYSKYNGLADFGGQQFKQDLTLRMTLEEEISSHDREPAEEEVKAVMAICSNCDSEPFQGAIVLAWKDVKEHMNNTLKGLSVGSCGHF